MTWRRWQLHERDTTNLEMRTFHCDLADEVQAEHRSRCPCCARPMVRSKNRKGKADQRRDVRTVAHDKPVSYGGDHAVWVFTCLECNHQQGTLTFRQWARRLSLHGDSRAAAVAALADRIDEFNRRKRHDTKLPVAAE